MSNLNDLHNVIRSGPYGIATGWQAAHAYAAQHRPGAEEGARAEPTPRPVREQAPAAGASAGGIAAPRVEATDLGRTGRSAPPVPLPDVYMPAMPPLALITALEHWVWRRVVRTRLWMRAWARRRRLQRLQDYDDHLLEDMGYTRQELAWALSLPMRVNARRALRRLQARLKARGLR